MASSFSLAQLIVARLVLGFGSGGYTATIPVWQSEMSGAQHRGAFVNWEGIFLGLGIVFAELLDFAFFFVTGNTVSWRFPFVFQIVFLLTVMGFIFTLPGETLLNMMFTPQLLMILRVAKMACHERQSRSRERGSHSTERRSRRSRDSQRRHSYDTTITCRKCWEIWFGTLPTSYGRPTYLQSSNHCDTGSAFSANVWYEYLSELTNIM